MTVLVISLCGTLALGQQGLSSQTAPHDKVIDFTLSNIEAVTKDLAATNRINQRLLEGGTFSLNIRHISGKEAALLHEKVSEVWVVRGGAGTLVTGGSLVDAEKGTNEGDQRGSSIRDGVERVIKAGDVIFIPPGVPHAIKETTSDVTYLNIRFETR